jgi:hypothetical protein
LLVDDATVVLPLPAGTSRVTATLAYNSSGLEAAGIVRAALPGMANKSLDERVGSLESSMGGRTLKEHFREHAELIDRRFGEVHARFAAQDKRFDAIDARFVAIDAQFVAVHARFEALDERLNRVDHELGFVRRDLGLILKKLSA